jgi:hypothetical protein
LEEFSQRKKNESPRVFERKARSVSSSIRHNPRETFHESTHRRRRRRRRRREKTNLASLQYRELRDHPSPTKSYTLESCVRSLRSVRVFPCDWEREREREREREEIRQEQRARNIQKKQNTTQSNTHTHTHTHICIYIGTQHNGRCILVYRRGLRTSSKEHSKCVFPSTECCKMQWGITTVILGLQETWTEIHKGLQQLRESLNVFWFCLLPKKNTHTHTYTHTTHRKANGRERKESQEHRTSDRTREKERGNRNTKKKKKKKQTPETPTEEEHTWKEIG